MASHEAHVSRLLAGRAWQSLRYRDPKLESIDPGFSLLLDAYGIIDFGILQTLQGRRPVCAAGCSYCCSQPIPLTPLEIMLIHVYARVHGVQHTQSIIFSPPRMDTLQACPFLSSQSTCMVYAVRPISCRQFLVFTTPCGPTEDVYNQRFGDVFRPEYAFKRTALLHTFPWYGTWAQAPAATDPKSILEFFDAITTLIQSVDWISQRGR